MPFSYGDASKKNLIGVHPRLVQVANAVILRSPIDFKIIEGVRSDEQCYINFGKGRTKAECIAGGCPPEYSRPNDNKVTWVKKALNSKHRKQADGFGHALDFLPAPYDWKNLRDFTTVAELFLTVGREIGQPVRWGADWDADGNYRERGETDNPHIEI